MRVLASHLIPTEVVEVTTGAFVAVENIPDSVSQALNLNWGPLAHQSIFKKIKYSSV